MDCIGRMAEIFLCILCLTLIPAGNALKTCQNREKNAAEIQAERFYWQIRQEKSLKAEDYAQFKKFFSQFPDYRFELTVARRYVMPAGRTPKGFPVKIMYRVELEEKLYGKEEIFLGGNVFVNISIYGKDGYFYTCGGEV
ncbi:MAG: hypothetical protein K2N63_07495 [Lachnospiraceae bacterium]|nr:hypothetical protein [Lachnospiraceae bacterium]